MTTTRHPTEKAGLTSGRASSPVLFNGEPESEMSDPPLDPDELRDPMSPREQIMANVAVIKQAIKLDWARMAEDALTPEEREELRAQIKEWTDDLATLGARLDSVIVRFPVFGFDAGQHHTARQNQP